MSGATSESILRYFPEASSSESAKSQLSNLSSSFAQSADDLFAKWEVFAIRKQAASYIDQATLDAFQEYLEQSQRSIQAKRQRLTPTTGPRIRFGGKIKTELDSTPPLKHVWAETLKSFQPNVASVDGAARVRFTLNTNLNDFTQRPFNMRLGDASKQLDDEIEKIIELVLESHKLERSDLVNPEQISQGLGVAVGRIRREVPPVKQNDEAVQQWSTKISANSMLLETSRRIGAGARSALDFRMVSNRVAHLFEGQIVALRGKNPQGDQFIVHEVLDLPKLPVARLAPVQEPDNSHSVTIAVASQPSTSQKLEEFFSWVTANRVSAIVIVGPLLSIEVGTETHKQKVISILNAMRSSLGVPVVIVPSSDDAFSIDSVFPQPPVTLNVDKPIIPVSNPCTFSFNEVAVTAAAVSTLKDLDQPSATAFEHVLRQRRLYPVYPQPPGVPIDVPHLELASLGKVAPNVLVLPAADPLKSDAFLVDDVICVAPGSLYNDQVALITVAQGTAPLATRTRVDLMKLNA